MRSVDMPARVEARYNMKLSVSLCFSINSGSATGHFASLGEATAWLTPLERMEPQNASSRSGDLLLESCDNWVITLTKPGAMPALGRYSISLEEPAHPFLSWLVHSGQSAFQGIVIGG